LPSGLPRRPPPLKELLERCGGLQETLSLLSLVASAAESDRYLHGMSCAIAHHPRV
jgi:hypothetical protein